MIWVRPDLAPLFGALAFDEFLALGGRTVKQSGDGSRRTSAFERGGRRFFVKAHSGVGWREIAKCWLQGKPAVVDAGTEARALARCAELGVPAPALAAFGVAGASPASRRSFVVTEELARAERLSELVARERPLPFALRRDLARRLGSLVARLHAGGLAHRDLYLEHVFLRRDGPVVQLYLLDLHRALPIRALPYRTRRERWLAKDLAGLAGSAARHGATRSDCARFLRAYAAAPRLGAAERQLWRRCARRAETSRH